MLERATLVTGDTLANPIALSNSNHRGHVAWRHSGADAGYRSFLVYVPERRLGVAVLANVATFDPVDMGTRVLDLYLGYAPKEPQRLQGLAVESAVVSLERLLNLEGEYKLEGGGRLDVVVSHGRLYVRLDGGEPISALALGEDEFVLSGGQLLRFNRGEDGAVLEVVARAGVREVVGTRLPRVAPAVLMAYTGEYFSSELGTSYTIAVRDGALVAEHRRHPPARLVMVGDDHFVGDRWGMGALRFTRDPEGRVDGFLLSGSRVRNLRFAAVSN
jgi:hypothetical protein